MVKFQRFIDVGLILYSCLLTSVTPTLAPWKEPTDTCVEDDNSGLQFVSVLFRHGDRTVIKNIESYPNDPYKDDNFYPVADGDLTNVGKNKAYELGVLLRKKYNTFLGNVYYPPNVYARSTFLCRTKMTLQLVLAGLYPPIDGQKWHSNFSWQPIDLIYYPKEKEDLLLQYMCPMFAELFNNVLEIPKVKEKIEKFSDLMKMTSNYTGQNINDLAGLLILYSTLSAQFSMPLVLPDWTQDIFPNGKLLNASLLFLDLLSYGDLKCLNGGVLLKRKIDDMDKVINRTMVDRKINLFSGHDLNVAAMLSALNIPLKHYPAFTSCVIIELHKKDRMYFVKVLHHLGHLGNATSPSKILEVKIPGCEILCPYNKFIKLTRDSTKTIDLPCDSSKTDKTPASIFGYSIHHKKQKTGHL